MGDELDVGVPSRFGAGEFFAEWGARDVADMVRRDRNHPSVIQWSIGNEVDTPNDSVFRTPFSARTTARAIRPPPTSSSTPRRRSLPP